MVDGIPIVFFFFFFWDESNFVFAIVGVLLLFWQSSEQQSWMQYFYLHGTHTTLRITGTQIDSKYSNIEFLHSIANSRHILCIMIKYGSLPTLSLFWDASFFCVKMIKINTKKPFYFTYTKEHTQYIFLPYIWIHIIFYLIVFIVINDILTFVNAFYRVLIYLMWLIVCFLFIFSFYISYSADIFTNIRRRATLVDYVHRERNIVW